MSRTRHRRSRRASSTSPQWASSPGKSRTPASLSLANAQAVPAEPIPRGPQATSSFAEAVAGAVAPLWPVGDSIDPPGAGTPTLGDAGPTFSTAAGPGSGGSGTGTVSDDGPPGGSHTGSLGGALPGEGIGGGTLPISAVPEPATWASLLAGLLALAGLSARRKARR